MRIAILTGAFFVTLLLADSTRAENWPCWRGPRGDGTSLESGVPTQWNAEKGDDKNADKNADKNIAWKVEISGTGHSSPVVWNDRIFLLTCREAEQERVLMCLDRKQGKLLWQQVVVVSPLEHKHKLNSFASSTPAVDGDQVYATFLDGRDMVVAAYDFYGKQRWSVRPGTFSSTHGFCSSPVLFEDKVIINGDHDGASYLVALDRKSGKTLWKVERENKTRSYSTPIVRQIDGRTQLIMSGNKCIASYDPHDGSRHWIIDGPTEQFVASMVFNGNLLFMTAGFPQHHMLAIRPDGRGNVTDTHIAWRTEKGAAYVPSPIAAGDYFLVVSDGGIASCFLAETGERLWMERIGTHFSTALTSAGGLVYFLADDGTMKIVRPGKTLGIVSENKLNEYTYASPAISQGQIFIRGEKHLFCIGNKP